MSYITQPDCVLTFCLGCNNMSTTIPLRIHTVNFTKILWAKCGRRRENISDLISSSSGRLTFENALAMQYVSEDNHCVEVLGEARSAWGFEELACLTPLRNRKDGLLSTGKLTCGQKVTSRSRSILTLMPKPLGLQWAVSDYSILHLVLSQCGKPHLGLKIPALFTVAEHRVSWHTQ